MADSVRVAIVGAGITGLALGHYLHQKGVPHLVLEKSDRVGGVMRSGRVDGHLLEWGPQRTRMTRAVGELIAQMELGEQVITAPPDLPLFVYRAGQLRRVPFSARDFLFSDIVPFSAKPKLLLEPFTRGAEPNERVADYFVRKLGRPVYESMVGPLYGGLYASDPANMVVGLSLGHVLKEFGIRRSLLLPLLRRGGSIDPPAAISFQDGMETLPRRLAELQGANLRLRCAAVGMQKRGDNWEIRTSDGDIIAESIVITTPAGAAASLLEGAASQSAAALRKLRYNPLAVVHLHAETDLRGLGYQVSFAEDLFTRGVTFNDSLFRRRGVYTAYLGGAKAPEVVEWTDGRIAEVAVDEFRRVTGADARPISVEREWMPAWDYTWAALKEVKTPAGVYLAANWESRPGIPGRLAQAKRLAGELAQRSTSPAAV